jgi:protein-S-isoprenylcysteine O-methyltransferase Ste14
MSVAAAVMAVCWAAWLLPFVFRARRVRGRQAAATDRRGIWGQPLEALALGVAAFGPGVEPGAARIAAAMLLAPAGPILAWWSVEHLGRQWRMHAGLWHDHRLITTGPYRFVRHPIYASILAVALATGLLRASWPAILLSVALFAAGTEIRVRVEDRLLASRFGKEFEVYRRSTRAYLPFIR